MEPESSTSLDYRIDTNDIANFQKSLASDNPKQSPTISFTTRPNEYNIIISAYGSDNSLIIKATTTEKLSNQNGDTLYEKLTNGPYSTTIVFPHENYPESLASIIGEIKSYAKKGTNFNIVSLSENNNYELEFDSKTKTTAIIDSTKPDFGYIIGGATLYEKPDDYTEFPVNFHPQKKEIDLNVLIPKPAKEYESQHENMKKEQKLRKEKIPA